MQKDNIRETSQKKKVKYVIGSISNTITQRWVHCSTWDKTKFEGMTYGGVFPTKYMRSPIC